MNALESLPIEEENEQLYIESDASDDASFFLFKRTMTEPMDQLDALAFTSEVITKAGKVDQWSPLLAKFYFDFIGNCEEKSFFHLKNSEPKGLSQYKLVHRSNLIKVFFVAVEMKINHANELLKSDVEGSELYMSAMNNLYEILEQTCRFTQSFWRTDLEGNPTSEAKEVSFDLNFYFSNSVFQSIFLTFFIHRKGFTRLITYLFLIYIAIGKVGFFCTIKISKTDCPFYFNDIGYRTSNL
jgi:hypothetical protein